MNSQAKSKFCMNYTVENNFLENKLCMSTESFLIFLIFFVAHKNAITVKGLLV